MHHNIMGARHVVLIALLLTLAVAYSLGTPAETVIRNQASISYTENGSTRTVSSNIVDTLVAGICSLSVVPDGSLNTPAHRIVARAGTTIYLPYRLTNTGNQANSYTLSAELLEGSSNVTTLAIYLDRNADGRLDAGDIDISASGLSNLAADASVDLLLAVTLDPAGTGNSHVNLSAACATDVSVQDNDNIARIQVVPGGVRDFSKTANPGNGTPLFAGDGIRYSISFVVDDIALTNLVLSDTLDPQLESPPRLGLSINGIDQSNQPAYDETTRTVSASFSELEYGDSVTLTISTVVRTDAAGNTFIENQAGLLYDSGSGFSESLSHPVVAVCRPLLSPDGTNVRPAHELVRLPGERVVLPYTLENAGNVTSNYTLTNLLGDESSFTSYSAFITEDLNTNGVVDANESALETITLAAGELANLLLVVDLGGESSDFGDLFITPVASCENGNRDDDNLARISVPLGGFDTPVKAAYPVAGSSLFPGASVEYSIRFDVNARDLRNVIITDVLDPRLEPPTDISTGVISDDNGLTAVAVADYNDATRTLSWQFDRLPAGMTVELRFTTRVREDLSDLPPESILSNTAGLTSNDSEPQATNEVSHDLRPVIIELDKSVTPASASISDTLIYTLIVSNPARSVTLNTIELTDILPDELRYIAGSSVVNYPDASSEALEPGVNGQTLVWTLVGIAPGESIQVTFEVQVLPVALFEEEIINKAQVVASDTNGRAVADAAAAVSSLVDPGIFAAAPVLLGTAFIDVNGNGLFDQTNDLPVEGLRLYLSDGSSTITDETGRYTFLNLQSSATALRVDTSTAPARFFQETVSEDKEAFWRLRLTPGIIHRQDIPFRAPEVVLEMAQTLNVMMGGVTVTKTVTVVSTDTARIRLTVTSSEALNNLRIQDQLTADAQAKSDNTLTLGDVAAGFSQTLEYDVRYQGQPEALLLAPTISWELR